MIKMLTKRGFLLAILASLLTMPSQAQESSQQLLSPSINMGLFFNADTNHPIFTGSLGFKLEFGKPTDWLGFNVGVGYRGFFDRNPPYSFITNRSFSDYMFYSDEYGRSKNVRPVGGQLVMPAEVQLRLISLGDNTRLFFGCGAEYGIRLYQSNRYANYYGDHIFNSYSLGIYPMIGVVADVDELFLSASLYWRHYTQSPFNYQNLYDKDKFDALNFFGFQIVVTLPVN